MNEYFLPGSVPATNAPGSSATIRSEFSSVAAAFDKLPVMAGNANEFVIINGAGTGLTSSGFVASDLATLSTAQVLTNKTLSWSGNTWDGFGTAATKNAGTSAGEVLLLAENNKLPILNGSNLTNLNPLQLGVVPVANGGTGAASISAAQVALGIDLKADANNTVLTGSPICPTPGVGDNSSKIANTLFVNAAIAGVSGMTPSNSAPLMNGTAASGSSVQASRADHVHPRDTSCAPLNSPVFTGNPTAPTPTPGDNDTSVATTAFVTAALAASGATLSSTNPLMNGVASPGAGTSATRDDHVHPVDTSRAPASAGTAAGTSFSPAGGISATNVQAALAELDSEKANLASPVFTGNPTAPTPATSDNDTSVATTAFVQNVIAAQTAGMLPSNDVPLMNGVGASGTGTAGARADHVHPADTAKQATLVSGTNIKTLNSVSLLGSGDINLGLGDTSTRRTIVVSGTSRSAVAGDICILSNVAATTVILPASPSNLDYVGAKAVNSLLTNIINPNGKNIEGVSGNMTIDIARASLGLQYFTVTGDWRFV